MSGEGAEQIRYKLSQFTGTENLYHHWTGYRYTDGIKAMADMCEAYWLIDLALSYAPEIKDNFAKWTFKPVSDGEFTAIATDGEEELFRQEKIISDFPLKEGVSMFFIDDTLLLPSEY